MKKTINDWNKFRRAFFGKYKCKGDFHLPYFGRNGALMSAAKQGWKWGAVEAWGELEIA